MSTLRLRDDGCWLLALGPVATNSSMLNGDKGSTMDPAGDGANKGIKDR
jgi:hypothetical protein